jgi:hypothetical protein
MHVIKAFTHLQVQSIPEKYILRRYTRNARSVVPWDRQSEADETQKSECSVVLQQSQAHGAIARIRRATSRNVDYKDDYESE